MRKIFRIARLEWSIMLYSPIAWLVFFAFLVEIGYNFWLYIQWTLYHLRMGTKLAHITERLYPDPYALFGDQEKFLSIFIPLLTMGLMSREYHNGTIKLLQSSPVNSREIVLGKYLSVVSFGFVLVLIVGMLGLQGHFAVLNHDDGYFISGLIGMFLLICAYSAIGLFMSSLTPYQLVAVVASIGTLTVLRVIRGLWQDIAIMRDITWFLSISGRNSTLTHGLISSKDLWYFLIIVLLFLGMMYIRLENSRDTRHWVVHAGKHVIYISGLLLLGYVTSRPRMVAYWDLTATKSMTLTSASQAVAKKVPHRLKIHTYVNILDDQHYMGMPAAELSTISKYSQYQRAIPYVDLDFTRYYDTCYNTQLYNNNPGKSTEELALMIRELEEYDGELLTPEQMKEKADLGKERYRVTWELESEGKKTNIRVYNDIVQEPMEAQISAALKRLVDTIQTVTFVTGHGERSIDRLADEAYRMVATDLNWRFSLPNDGFDVNTVDLRKSDIPSSTSILVIADPQLPFSDTDAAKVERYIAKGGNLFIAGEPGRQEFVNRLIRSTGVSLLAGSVQEESKDYGPDFVRAWITAKGELVYPNYRRVREHGFLLEMPGAAAIAVEGGFGFSVDTLAESKIGATWIRTANDSAASSAGEAASGHSKASKNVAWPLMVQLHRTVGAREQRIVIAGDADFMKNAAMTKSNPMIPGNPYANYDAMTATFYWLSYGEYPLDDSRPVLLDNKLRITASELETQKLLWRWILPGIVLLIASVVLIRRKRN